MFNPFDYPTLFKFKDEPDLLNAIAQIGEIFNFQRHRLQEVYKDPRLVSAYFIFFASTNYPLFYQALKLLPISTQEEIVKNSFIDYCAGPGIFSYAFAQMALPTTAIYAYDQSSLMKDQASLWLNQLTGLKSKIEWVGQDALKGQQNATLFFSHGVNEIKSAEFFQLIDMINPARIFWIEPGTKESFSHLMSIRQRLLEDYQVVYPCSASVSCPMAETTNWCHQVLKLQHHPEIERLSQMLHNDRRHRTVIIHLYQRRFSEQASRLAQVIRVIRTSKAGIELEVCIADNHQLILKNFDLLYRDHQYEKKLLTQHCLPGQKLAYDVKKVLSPTHERVSIKIC